MAVRSRMHTALMISIAVAALLAVTMTPVQGQVAENKTFRLDVSGVPAGDANATLEITITNTSTNQSLGSANVTAPSPFDLLGVTDEEGDPSVEISASDPQTIELRGLGLAPVDPDESFTFLVTVDVQRCTEGDSEEFEATAKQSNTYLGTGNDFFWENPGLTASIDGTCSLEFVDQPADAEREMTITSAPYDDQGDPITVDILDASADRERATHSTATVDLTAQNPDVPADDIVLGGTTSVEAVAGFASFEPGPTLAPSAFDYAFVASADFDGGGTDATVTSTAFDIVDDAVDCPPNQPCAEAAVARRQNQVISVTFGAGATQQTLAASLGAFDAPGFTCENSSASSLAGQFFLSGVFSERLGTVVYEVMNAQHPANAYEICWAAPYPFKTDNGEQSTVRGVTKPDGSVVDLNVGELPDCSNRAPVRPCVRHRSFDNPTSTVTIEIATDNRDPWMRH
ncbi:MAG TPA: hypothetical protein VFZ70_00735 [Euzebyales bacterium]